jgi:hypothetical protein
VTTLQRATSEVRVVESTSGSNVPGGVTPASTRRSIRDHLTPLTSTLAVLRELRDSAEEVADWFATADGLAELERAYPIRPRSEK